MAELLEVRIDLERLRVKSQYDVEIMLREKGFDLSKPYSGSVDDSTNEYVYRQVAPEYNGKTTAEIIAENEKFKERLNRFLFKEVSEFVKLTGVVPDLYVSVKYERTHPMGKHPEKVFSHVEVTSTITL